MKDSTRFRHGSTPLPRFSATRNEAKMIEAWSFATARVLGVSWFSFVEEGGGGGATVSASEGRLL